MSRLFAYSATQAGIARLARARQTPALTVEARKPEPAPAHRPVANNVVRFRRPAVTYEARRMASAKDFSRAKHLAFLASLHIATSTPFSVLIGRVAAWHGYTLEQMIESHGPRERIEARTDCIIAVRQAYPKTSLPRLGQIFGGRDHTTIIHYLRKRGL